VIEEKSDRSLSGVIKHVIEGDGGREVIHVHRDIVLPAFGKEVDAYRYSIGGVTHFQLVPKGTPPGTSYDNHHLPRFLFLGAAALTFTMLLVIFRPLQRVRKLEGT
jgi:hypothetical protein